jgi:MFS family permease
MSTAPDPGSGHPSWEVAFGNRFAALRHRNFRFFWTGHAVSVIGTWMQNIAVFWLIYRLTDSPFILGLTGVAFFLPILLFSVFAGVLADRVNRKRLVQTTQALHFLQACTLASLVTFGEPTAPLVLSLALVQGMINAFDFPGRQSFISELVPIRDLPNAIALNSMAFNMARLVGPAIGGMLLATVGEAACFWINAVSYLWVSWRLTLIRLPKTEKAVPDAPLKALREGVSYAFGNPRIRSLLILLGLVGTLGFQFIVLLPVFAKEILGAGAQEYGLLMTASGVGSLSAFFRLTSKLDRPAMRRNLMVGLTLLGCGLIAFSLSRVYWLSLCFGLVLGLGMILYSISTNMLIQTTVKNEYRGRVMSLFTLMLVGTSPVGSFIMGTIAERFGAPNAVRIAGIVCLLGAIWVVHRLRVIQRQEIEQGINLEGSTGGSAEEPVPIPENGVAK